jgi:hypothetical protein
MPQWKRDAPADRARYPDERWRGTCARESAALLLRYDHHVVWIGGRAALLLTYAWATQPLDAWLEPLAFEVSFTYARGHPRAPAEVQALVDSLTLRPDDANVERDR